MKSPLMYAVIVNNWNSCFRKIMKVSISENLEKIVVQ